MDAMKVAETAVLYAARKRVDWSVQTSPWIHNILVNAKLKKHGLCYHWANGMWIDLSSVLPPEIKMTLIETRPRFCSLEHHVISLHHADKYWTEGIILDAWKGNGTLFHEDFSLSRRSWQFESSVPYYNVSLVPESHR